MPRILRRGMGYGPLAAEAPADADRGTLFMAYCASICRAVRDRAALGRRRQQQRRGVDTIRPAARRAAPGERACFAGSMPAARRSAPNSGPRPLSSCSGACTFSCPRCRRWSQLADFRNGADAAPAAGGAVDPARGRSVDLWRDRLEDRTNGRATWKAMREKQGGELDVPAYGQLVGSAAGVFDGLATTRAKRVSVRGFGQRMDDTGLGINHLGMDPSDGHAAVGKIVNSVVGAIDEFKAFAAGTAAADAVLSKLLELSSRSVRTASPRRPAACARRPDELFRTGRQRARQGVVRLARRHAHGRRWPHPRAVTAQACRAVRGTSSGPRVRSSARIRPARHCRRSAPRTDGSAGREGCAGGRARPGCPHRCAASGAGATGQCTRPRPAGA